MTDRPDAPEIASALHDGEAAEDERARAGDGDVVAARQVVAAVAAEVGDVPPPPAGLVDDHVAAALAAFDAPASDVPDDGTVVPMAGRRPWTQRVPLGAVAAAVAVVALVGALGLAGTGGDDDGADDTATAALDADEAGDGAVAEAFDAESGTAAGGTSLTGGEREAYGSYEELATALAERVDGADAPGGSAAPTEDAVTAPAADATEEAERSGAAGCDPVAAAGLDPVQARLVSPVLVADRLVTAVVHGAGDDLRLTVVDDEGCAVVEERPLRG